MKRRHFLQYTLTTGLMLPFIKGFGLKTLAKSPLLAGISMPAADTDRVLVLIQLTGGNDGLNTVVPIDQLSALNATRPQVVLPENSLLSLADNDTVGLHPSMSGLQQWYNEGKVAIVQSVGYLNQDYSHFRSTDIWMSGSSSDEVLSTGWLGRYLGEEYPNYPNEFPNPNMPDPLAIEIGNANTLTFQGQIVGMSYALQSPDQLYDLVSGVQTPLPNTPAGEQLQYVRFISRQAQAYSNAVVQAYSNGTSTGNYPSTYLAQQLQIVARLIHGGLKTRVYMVNIGGFDTHSNQVQNDDHTVGEHANLLGELSDAIAAFMADIQLLGIDNRVLGMTFSEFGRRIISNESGGTDHGAAAPMFLFGSQVAGGIYGDNPSIPINATEDDNLPMQYDFRSIYATILKDWFCVPQNSLINTMLQEFSTLPLLNTPDCIPTSVRDLNQQSGASLIAAMPSVFAESTTIQFNSQGGNVLIQVLNAQGQIIAVIAKGIFGLGKHQVVWDAAHLPAGLYYVRLQNEWVHQVKTLYKTT